MLSSFLVIVPFIAGINALNDWTVACTSGECSYALPPDLSKSGGSNNAITDITKAADWQILGCDSNALAQDIRLVCLKDPDDPNSQCSHLYQEIGAVNKIVRLPEDCGASAFARVAKSWVPEDQSIPNSVRRSLLRRDGKVPVVKALSLDTNFDAVDWSKTGPVNIAIQGVNVPGVQTGDLQVTLSRRRTINPRFSLKGALGAVKDGLEKAAKDVVGVAKDAVGAVKDVAGAVKDAAESVVDNSIDANKTFDLKPLTFSKHVNLINSQLDCGKVSASLQVDMDANANAQASISVAATGTIIPPKMTKFGIVAALTANVAGTMTMNADITGHVDSGKIELVNLGVPAFDLPGIFTLGPSFTVSAQVVGDVDVVMDMQVGLNFDINNAQLTFPPDASNKPLSSAFSISDTPLTLNAAGDVTATGTLTAHLIPSLNLGVSVLGGKAKADIFLDIDTNAVLQMNLDASASATKVVTPPTIDNSASSSQETISADATSTATDTASPDDGSSSDASGSAELFQVDDGELVDANGNPVDENGAPLPEGASPLFVDQDGNIVPGPTSGDAADAKPKRANDAQVQLFQGDNGELVNEAGEPVDENGKKLGPNDAPVFVDNDGNIVDGPMGDDSTAAAQLFQTDDGELVDESGNPVDAEGNLLKDGDSPVCADTDGNVIACPAGVTDNAAAATDDTTATADDVTVNTTADVATTSGTETTKSLGGCINVNGGISINAGAEGSFFGLFDKVANARLFDKNFKIFNKCFGDQVTAAPTTTAADSTSETNKRAQTSLEGRAAFTCPLGGSKKLGVTQGTVKSSNIQPA
ncbi:hypothetical protein B0H19DRAFT_1262481 [Mycena capillaripes]|nr:hypothetical protein B0H19DRAFT_1262481 [Mycena capillaripes]